jgi:hypothetical protein
MALAQWRAPAFCDSSGPDWWCVNRIKPWRTFGIDRRLPAGAFLGCSRGVWLLEFLYRYGNGDRSARLNSVSLPAGSEAPASFPVANVARTDIELTIYPLLGGEGWVRACVRVAQAWASPARTLPVHAPTRPGSSSLSSPCGPCGAHRGSR